MHDAPAAMPHRRSRRCVAMAIGLMLGLLVITGLSAFSSLVCSHDAAPTAVQSLVQGTSAEVTVASGSPGQSTTTASVRCSDSMGETCVPLRPSTSSALMVVLVLGLALLLPLWPGVARFLRERAVRYSGPPQAGLPARLTLCVCRT